MVIEVVDFRIKEGMVEQFIEGTAASRSLFEQAPGFVSLELHHEVEDPLNCMIQVTWNSIEDHFAMQKTPIYPQIRDMVIAFLEEKPKVRHTEVKVRY